METIFILFVLGIIGVVLIGSILGLTSSGTIAKLQRQNLDLNARLETLEKALDEGRLETVAPAEKFVASDPEIGPSSVPDSVPDVEPKPDPFTESIFTPKPTQDPVQGPAQTPQQAVAAKAAEPASLERVSLKTETPSRNLEELIGGQWSVWVGGLALLVGAVLLIRFSIEAGIFGPGARIVMAFVLGASLLLAGEWLKRSDDKELKGKFGEAAKALQDNASVPGLLSAVGVFTLLGASYAAHALYGLIPAFAAFMALALISLGAMALSLRQGPLLAGIGLLASLATPLLIQTDTPSFLMLVLYLVLVGGAALALSRRMGWGWLATGTVFGWLGWNWLSHEAATSGQLWLWGAFLGLGFIITVWFAQQHKSPNVENDDENRNDLDLINLQPGWAILWGGMAALLVVIISGASKFVEPGSTFSEFILGLASIFALTGASLFYRKQSAHLVTAGVLCLVFLMMAKGQIQTVILMMGLAAIVILSFLKTKINSEESRVDIRSAWSIFAVALGLISVVILSLTNRADQLDILHAATALGFTGLFAGVGIWFKKRGAHWDNISVPILGAGLGWALTALLGFDDMHFSLFLSLGTALAGLAIWRFPIAGTRFVLLGLAGLVFAHALFVQFLDAKSISTRPVFNALWIYLALPAAILAGAAYILNSRKAERGRAKLVNGVIEAAALAGFALFAVFQIRHLSNGGEVYADRLGHAELGLQLSIGLCFTLAGLSKRFSGNPVLSKIAEVISYVTLAGFGLGSLLFVSPLFDRGEIITGNAIFNSLTTGLLVPTVLLGLCAVMARGKRPEFYINIFGGLALAGALSWVTAMIRFLFNGTKINLWSVDCGSLELWTISTVWLAFGISLLALGVWRKEQALRIASGVVIILTVLKAFLIDMAGLEGVLRALSFVALGLILIVIGGAYQRFWLTDEAVDPEDRIVEEA